jgi:hypothetical protein
MLLLGSGLLGTLLSLKMGISGLADPLIGLIMGGFYAGMMLGGIVCYRIVQRVGHIRAFAAFAAFSCALIMVHGLYAQPLDLVAAARDQRHDHDGHVHRDRELAQ